MAAAEILADGPARDVLVASPVFAPQTAKILAPLPYLTIHDVERELAGGDDG
jgi:energy-coupling factor transport system ATP-binding protein